MSVAHKKIEYYKAQVQAAKETVSTLEQGEKPQIAHYSYDLTKQVPFPFSTQQTEPEYFKTAHKCGIFGVCNDSLNKQHTYLIDKAENRGKGADCVISLLHHYFENERH